MGSKPRLLIGGEESEAIVFETDDGWHIEYGFYIIATSYFTINEQNKTVHTVSGI